MKVSVGVGSCCVALCIFHLPASCKCVRPILMMWLKLLALASKASLSNVMAGTRRFLISSTAAICIDVGNLRKPAGRGRVGAFQDDIAVFYEVADAPDRRVIHVAIIRLCRLPARGYPLSVGDGALLPSNGVSIFCNPAIR